MSHIKNFKVKKITRIKLYSFRMIFEKKNTLLEGLCRNNVKINNILPNSCFFNTKA